MLASLIAHLILVVFVAPLILFVAATAFALAASQLGEFAGVVAATVAAGGLLIGLDRWLAFVAEEYGPRSR